MDAFNLFYAVGSLIAAALVAAVVYFWPIFEVFDRDRFEETFGFRPPKSKRGPGSQPIPWERRDMVAAYLREAAAGMDKTLRGMRAGLRTLIDMDESERAVRWPKHLIWNLAAQFLSSYVAFYRARRQFRYAHQLAMQFGFILSGRAGDDCGHFARIAKTQR
jgi:hypothetical protein